MAKNIPLNEMKKEDKFIINNKVNRKIKTHKKNRVVMAAITRKLFG
jgi:hypothetical protein